MKNYSPLLLAVLMALCLSLSGCEEASNAEVPEASTSSITNWHAEPPLDEVALQIATPDFLNEEQALLYRKAHFLYRHMWNGETSALEYLPLWEGDYPYEEATETIEIEGISYCISKGRYKNWGDFTTLIESVFTQEQFKKRNEMDGFSVYRAYGDTLCYLDASRGGSVNYNDNFEDSFALIEATEDVISFTVTGHFSQMYPIGDETIEERDERVLSCYEYTDTAEIEMVLTENGWRFSEFTLVSDAG